MELILEEVRGLSNNTVRKLHECRLKIMVLQQRISHLEKCIEASEVYMNIVNKIPLSAEELPKEQFINELTNLFKMERNNYDEISRNCQMLNNLLQSLEQWFVDEERIRIELEERRLNSEKLNRAVHYIECVKTILAAESGKHSILSSFSSKVPEEQWASFLENVNRFLEYFHFPKNFIPIQISSQKEKGKKVYGLMTSDETNLFYKNLSLGQKTQLLMSFIISLNFALADRMPHKVIMLDDFTICLDMAQIVPASLILRKLAYTEDERFKRQVIITSHHEEMTNKLIEQLWPPQNGKMKVISINDWNIKKKPSIGQYYIEAGNVDLSSAISQLKKIGILKE